MKFEPLLDVRDLSVGVQTKTGLYTCLDAVSFSLQRKDVLGILGESGAGKSQLILSIAGLTTLQPGIIEGHIAVNGIELLEKLPLCLTRRESTGKIVIHKNNARYTKLVAPCFKKVRGKLIGIVLQESTRYLDNLYSIKHHFEEILRTYKPELKSNDRKEFSIALLDRLRFHDSISILKKYPYELSGGQGQRISIALALATGAELLLLDEPTASLDGVAQAHIMDIFRELNEKYGVAMVFVTHNPSLLERFATKCMILYKGQVVELGPGNLLSQRQYPQVHPYTHLLRLIQTTMQTEQRRRLPVITKQVESEAAQKAGCYFVQDCPLVNNLLNEELIRCRTITPELRSFGSDHLIRCHWIENYNLAHID